MRPRKDAATHGTRTMYQKGCRCSRCVVADKQYHLARFRGELISGYTPATQTAERVSQLLEAGMTRRQIERAAGVDYETLRRLTSDPAVLIHRKTEAGILALDPAKPLYDLVEPHAYIPAAPYRELVVRLWSQGYSLAWIGERIGYSDYALYGLRKSSRRIRAHHAKAIADLAEFVGDSKGIARDGKALGTRGGTKRPRAEWSCRNYDVSTRVDVSRLDRILEARGLDYRSFEQLVGLADSQLAQIRKRGSCSASTLERIASALYMREDELTLEGAVA